MFNDNHPYRRAAYRTAAVHGYHSVSTGSAKRRCPHGTSATAARYTSKQTSHISAITATVEVVVLVAVSSVSFMSLPLLHACVVSVVSAD